MENIFAILLGALVGIAASIPVTVVVVLVFGRRRASVTALVVWRES